MAPAMQVGSARGIATASETLMRRSRGWINLMGINMECIKTGADVIVSPYRIHGDLFRDDKRGLYVLNATGCHSGAQYVDGIFAVANISFGRNWDRVGEIYFCSIADADSEFFYYPKEIQVL